MDKAIYNEPWFVYIAECRDKTFYVGVAKDAQKRIEEHNKTKKCRYTRCRKPLKLMYRELCPNYSVARRRESEIKRYTKKKKLALMETRREKRSGLQKIGRDG